MPKVRWDADHEGKYPDRMDSLLEVRLLRDRRDGERGDGEMDSKSEELKDFLTELIRSRGLLTRQEVKTLRGQALNGDLDGARRGLARILKMQSGES